MKVPQFLSMGSSWVHEKKQSIMPSECMELFSLKYTVVVDTTALKTHSHIDRFKETHTTIADSSPMVLWYMAMLQWPAQATWKVTFFLIWGHSNAVGFCRQGLQYFDREIQQVERWTLTWERWGGQAVLVAKLQCSSNNRHQSAFQFRCTQPRIFDSGSGVPDAQPTYAGGKQIFYFGVTCGGVPKPVIVRPWMHSSPNHSDVITIQYINIFYMQKHRPTPSSWIAVCKFPRTFKKHHI